MKTALRYQNGCLYEDHGAWYVKYRQRIAQEDGSSKLTRASKFLGRTEDFANIFDVERCRAFSGVGFGYVAKISGSYDLPLFLMALVLAWLWTGYAPENKRVSRLFSGTTYSVPLSLLGNSESKDRSLGLRVPAAYPASAFLQFFADLRFRRISDSRGINDREGFGSHPGHQFFLSKK